MNNKRIVFVDPPFSMRNLNTAGIAFLRGYLLPHGIDFSSININRYIEIDSGHKDGFNDFLEKAIIKKN